MHSLEGLLQAHPVDIHKFVCIVSIDGLASQALPVLHEVYSKPTAPSRARAHTRSAKPVRAVGAYRRKAVLLLEWIHTAYAK